jgi:hypothetical protein
MNEVHNKIPTPCSIPILPSSNSTVGKLATRDAYHIDIVPSMVDTLDPSITSQMIFIVFIIKKKMIFIVHL